MTDFILGIIIISIVGAAVFYIRKQSKNGVKCIGCPDAKTCAAKNDKSGSACVLKGTCSGNCSGCNGGCCSHTDTR